MTSRGQEGRDGFLVPRIPNIIFPRDKGHQHFATWLLVRAAAGDDGTRPLPAGAVFWESPDVWVESSAGLNQPVPGEANAVFARVSNLGLEDATGVTVRFWWANPSIAITEASAHLIGIGSTDVLSQSTAIVECPNKWVPVIENNGHECLLAEAFIPGFDPLSAALDPFDDRHVGQKNEQLLILQNGMQFSASLQALNFTERAQQLTFEVTAPRLAKAPPFVEKQAANSGLKILPRAAELPLQLQPAASTFFLQASPGAHRLFSETARSTSKKPPVRPQISKSVDFKPLEARNIEISGRVPQDARPGQLFTFRVTQQINRRIVGGYTIYVLVGKR